jgi:hypothetical protein
LCIDAITLSAHAAAQRCVCDCLRVSLEIATELKALRASPAMFLLNKQQESHLVTALKAIFFQQKSFIHKRRAFPQFCSTSLWTSLNSFCSSASSD